MSANNTETADLDTLLQDIQYDNYLEFLTEDEYRSFVDIRKKVMDVLGAHTEDEFILPHETEGQIAALYDLRVEAKARCTQALLEERGMNQELARSMDERERTAEERQVIVDVQQEIDSKTSQVMQWILGIFRKRDTVTEAGKKTMEAAEIEKLRKTLHPDYRQAA
jgi:hypothetical protein